MQSNPSTRTSTKAVLLLRKLSSNPAANRKRDANSRKATVELLKVPVFTARSGGGESQLGARARGSRTIVSTTMDPETQKSLGFRELQSLRAT